MEFGLFETDERTLEEGARHMLSADAGSQETRAAYAALLDAFRNSYREKRRLIRVSDKLQEKLASLNDELQRSKEAAEEALHRLRETQEDLIQAEKMASLGVLVAGVAHEINTPVGTALASASFLKQQTERFDGDFRAKTLRRSDLEKYVANAVEATSLIQSSCRRAAELIQGFKQVAVDQTSAERRSFALAAYMRDVLVSLGPRLKQARHRIDIDCPEDIVVDGSPGAFSQVLTNLILNSLIHGYDEDQAGRITIGVEDLGDGRLRMRYADDGRGISPDALPRIFDPFYTNRRGAGGSGLGLHIVYNTVVGTLRGQIAATSTLGQGVVFTITFPMSSVHQDCPSQDAAA